MSTTANSVPPYVFEQKGTHPAPFTFDVPASLEVRPDTATAKFDGTGASGPFLACLTFYGSDGERLGRMFNPQVLQPGDIAEVTYIPPFGSAAASAAPAAGIRFGIDNLDSVAEPGLQIEPDQYVPNNFSQPAAVQTPAESTNYSLALNPANGTVLTCAPDNQSLNGNAVLTIFDRITAGDHGAFGLQFFVEDLTPNGTQLVQGLFMNVTSDGHHTTEVTGVVVNLSGGEADSVAGDFTAQAQAGGTGREIAMRLQTVGNLAGAKSLALLCEDNTLAPIFEVRNDGSVHIKTGTAIIADL